MRHKFSILSVVVIASLITAYNFRGTLIKPVLERAIPQMMSTTILEELGDGLHVAMCGAGGPMPDPKRSGACMIIVAGDNLLMVDSGSGGPRNVGRMRLPIGEIDAVLLTHFHSDHIDGLGETATLRWAAGANTSPLPIIGPTGVSQVVNGFNMAYLQDTVYRHDHHGDTVAPLSGKGMTAQPFATPASGESVEVWNQDGLVITAFGVDHEPVRPSVGYRLEYQGRSVVISGDTAQSSNLELFSQDADLLLHEALSRTLVGMMNTAAKQTNNAVIEKVTFDILDYHASPTEAAQSAEKAGVTHLALYHIVPPIIVAGQDQIFMEGVDNAFSGTTTLTEDGMIFSLPANSGEVTLFKKGL